MSILLFRIAVNFTENVRVGEESAETGFRAEEDAPAAMLRRREVLRVGVAEYSSA
jgi:hypothetical protein